MRLTQRAADKWESPRFLAVFNASAGFRFRAVAASRPLAANADRWTNTKDSRLLFRYLSVGLGFEF